MFLVASRADGFLRTMMGFATANAAQMSPSAPPPGLVAAELARASAASVSFKGVISTTVPTERTARVHRPHCDSVAALIETHRIARRAA